MYLLTLENIWKKAFSTCLLNTENDLKCQVDLWDMDLLHMEGVGFSSKVALRFLWTLNLIDTRFIQIYIVNLNKKRWGHQAPYQSRKLDAFHFEKSWSLSNPLLLCKPWDCFGHGLPIRIIYWQTISRAHAHVLDLGVSQTCKAEVDSALTSTVNISPKYNFPASIQRWISID